MRKKRVLILILLILIPLFFISGSIPPTAAVITNYTPVEDTNTDDGNPDVNYGTWTTCAVQESESDRAFLKFDLLGVTGIISAILYTKTSSVGGYFNVDAHGCNNQTWLEEVVTHNNAPAVDGTKQDTEINVAVNNWNSFDVTTWVAAHENQNVTIVLKSDDPNLDWFRFHSKEAASSDDYPYLAISTYSAPTTDNCVVNNPQLQFDERFNLVSIVVSITPDATPTYVDLSIETRDDYWGIEIRWTQSTDSFSEQVDTSGIVRSVSGSSSGSLTLIFNLIIDGSNTPKEMENPRNIRIEVVDGITAGDDDTFENMLWVAPHMGSLDDLHFILMFFIIAMVGVAVALISVILYMRHTRIKKII